MRFRKINRENPDLLVLWPNPVGFSHGPAELGRVLERARAGLLTREQIERWIAGAEEYARWREMMNRRARDRGNNAIAVRQGNVLRRFLSILGSLKAVAAQRPNPESPPREAPSAWARCHMTDADESDFVGVGDVPGLPKVVWALGFWEAATFVNSAGNEGEISVRHSLNDGPWLVSDPNDKKSLWIVARRADQLVKLRKYAGRPMSAIAYWPSRTSGKFDPHRGYQHRFGDPGPLPKSRWNEAWPRLVPVRGSNGRAYEVMAPVRFGFVVKPNGITG